MTSEIYGNINEQVFYDDIHLNSRNVESLPRTSNMILDRRNARLEGPTRTHALNLQHQVRNQISQPLQASNLLAEYIRESGMFFYDKLLSSLSPLVYDASSWNINGYNSSMLGNKLGTDDFKDVINKHDLLAIVERTRHMMQSLIFVICMLQLKTKTLFGVNSIEPFFNFHKDIYLETVSVSPSNFERSKSVDLIRKLDAKMLPFFLQKGDIVVEGDFNARTGDMQETISDDDSAFLNEPEDYEADELYIRQS